MIARLVFAIGALTGCVASPADEDLDETEQNSTTTNGVSLNGVSLNGVSLNGVSLNGVSLNGVSLNGVSLNGVSLNGVSLNGTNLNVAGVAGSTWTAILSTGETLPLRIDSAVRGTGTNADVGMYAISYATGAGRQPLCGVDAAGQPVLAIAVPGVWNLASGVPGGGAYTASTIDFTIACRGKTVAKCVELGYKPWAGRTPQLASCVRMLRADYCGNGTPYTADGKRVNVYDNIGVQLDTEAWLVEAEWTPAGARCITLASVSRLEFERGSGGVPSCVYALSAGPSCAGFNNGAVLVNEVPPVLTVSKLKTSAKL